MAGGDISLLYGNNSGAPYGNSMWQYIQNSLDPAKPASTHQKVRKVSYTKDWFFDVQENKTMKHFYTGSEPMYLPRLWDPIFPKNGDLVMDTLYQSVKPCRPGGKEQDCCSLNIADDWQETTPLIADCDALHREAKNLFAIEGGCPKNKRGKNLNPVCVEKGEVSNGMKPKDLSLWSNYGAAGPFTNSKGQPLNGLPMKCVCYGLDGRTSADKFDYFIVRNMGPSQCGRSIFPLLIFRPAQSIPCNGSLAFDFPPRRDLLQEYVDQGFARAPLKRVLELERNELSIFAAPDIINSWYSYMGRKNRTEWPAINKFPFNVYMDTCKEKGITAVPFPILSLTPYMLGTPDPTIKESSILANLGLCAPASVFHYFCPSHQNPTLKPVARWHIDRFNPYGVFADGTLWKPMGLIECLIKCPIQAKGTAYIGNGPHGLVV
jgi:hypothetical protein